MLQNMWGDCMQGQGTSAGAKDVFTGDNNCVPAKFNDGGTKELSTNVGF